MRNDHLLEIKRAKYNGEKTAIILQCIFCGIILLAIFGLKWANSEWIAVIREYLHEDMDWQMIYERLLRIKDSILHYIR